MNIVETITAVHEEVADQENTSNKRSIHAINMKTNLAQQTQPHAHPGFRSTKQHKFVNLK